MRKYLAAAVITAALVIPAAGSSAVLEKGAGSGCPDGQQGTFAFTINQTTPCTGSFTGTGSIKNGGTRLTGTYSGASSCTGAVNASFVVNRS